MRPRKSDFMERSRIKRSRRESKVKRWKDDAATLQLT